MKRLPFHRIPFDGVDLPSVSAWPAPARQPGCAQPLTLSSGLHRMRVLYVPSAPHAALSPGFVPCVVSISLQGPRHLSPLRIWHTVSALGD